MDDFTKLSDNPSGKPTQADQASSSKLNGGEPPERLVPELVAIADAKPSQQLKLARDMEERHGLSPGQARRWLKALKTIETARQGTDAPSPAPSPSPVVQTSSAKAKAKASKRRGRNNNRSRTRSFLQFPDEIQDHPNYRAMDLHSQLLLVHIGRFLIQGKSGNNGNLTCTFNQMQPLGWKSKETLSKAIKQCLDAGFLIKTRAQGLSRNPCRYAVTWCGINETGEQYDAPWTACNRPLRLWTQRPSFPSDLQEAKAQAKAERPMSAKDKRRLTFHHAGKDGEMVH